MSTNYETPTIAQNPGIQPAAIPIVAVIAAVGAFLYGAVVTITGAALVNVKWAVTHTSVDVTSKKIISNNNFVPNYIVVERTFI
ncbi:hypothetical protein [Garciella nitratireducens]|uniref:Uncharacterized protein n=1 Tax=Garciella nitratireducens DSM 15102 TaxID=1121911 RepID=A0A1T4N6D2_9FIRM|nr:hypothetical protein [Garciella nitratireducens]SJZ74665.1 hypothetical protein SAMN02745973_01574 [Garciella nitratireducens DSM 15102]